MVEPALAMLPQLSRYTLVSALALVLDFTVYLLLAAGGTTGALAGAIGYACGLALHYLLSVRYVFDAAAAHKGQSRLIAEFALSGLAGMAITALVIAVTVDLGGMPLLPAKVSGCRRELPGGLCAAARRRVCRTRKRAGADRLRAGLLPGRRRIIATYATWADGNGRRSVCHLSTGRDGLASRCSACD